MRLTIVLVAGGLLGAFAACTPARDNVNDPALDPIAVLTVTSSGGVSTGSRMTLFHVDASGSYDPFGATPVKIDFDLDDDPSTFETPGPSCAAQQTNCFVDRTLALPPDAALDAGVGGGVRTVRVRVTASSGHRAYASATVKIVNRAPTVDLGPDRFVPDAIGATVVLDPCGSPCRSFDPDGDPLSWTWVQLRGDAVALSQPSADGAVTFVAPTTTQALLFEATATDGLAVRTARLHVFVGPRTIVRSFSPARTFAFHGDYAVRVLGATEEGRLVTTDPQTGDVFVELRSGGSNEQVVRMSNDPAEIERWTYSTNAAVQAASIAPTGDGGACITRSGSPNAFVRLRSGIASPSVQSLPGGELALFVFAKADQSGTCWALSSTKPYLLAADGSSLSAVAGGSPYSFLETAAQDSDGSVWMGDCPTDFGTGYCATSTLRRWTGTAPALDIATMPGHIAEIVPDTAGGAFVWTRTGTYAQKTWRVLANGQVLPLNADVAVEGNQGNPSAAYDPSEHYLWVRDYFSKTDIVRFRDEGSDLVRDIVVTPNDFGGATFDVGVSIAFDARSARAFVLGGPTGAATRLAAIPLHATRLEVLPAPGPASLVGPLPDGTSWNGAYDPTGTALVDPVERLDDAGSLVASYASGPLVLHDLVASTGGEAAFAVETPAHSGEIRRVDGTGALVGAAATSVVPFDRLAQDLGADTMCASRFDFAAGASAAPSRISGLAAGAPSATVLTYTPPATAHEIAAIHRDGSCWFLDMLSGGGGHLLRFAPTGATAAVNLTSINGTAISGAQGLAIDPRDGSAWVADSLTNPRITRISAAGALVSAWTLPVPPSGGPEVVTALAVEPRCATAGDPACLRVWWVSYDTATSQAYLNSARATLTTPVPDTRVPLAMAFPLTSQQRLLWTLP